MEIILYIILFIIGFILGRLFVAIKEERLIEKELEIERENLFELIYNYQKDSIDNGQDNAECKHEIVANGICMKCFEKVGQKESLK